MQYLGKLAILLREKMERLKKKGAHQYIADVKEDIYKTKHMGKIRAWIIEN